MSNPNRLLFVNTNIWLDFYRARTDAGLALLRRLDAIRDKLIMTHQVEMEFKKHRQEAILEGFWMPWKKGQAGVPRPGLFFRCQDRQGTQTRTEQCGEENVHAEEEAPASNGATDSLPRPVYRVCQRCFHKDDTITLTRAMKVRFQVRRRRLFGGSCLAARHGRRTTQALAMH